MKFTSNWEIALGCIAAAGTLAMGALKMFDELGRLEDKIHNSKQSEQQQKQHEQQGMQAIRKNHLRQRDSEGDG